MKQAAVVCATVLVLLAIGSKPADATLVVPPIPPTSRSDLMDGSEQLVFNNFRNNGPVESRVLVGEANLTPGLFKRISFRATAPEALFETLTVTDLFYIESEIIVRSEGRQFTLSPDIFTTEEVDFVSWLGHGVSTFDVWVKSKEFFIFDVPTIVELPLDSNADDDCPEGPGCVQIVDLPQFPFTPPPYWTMQFNTDQADFVVTSSPWMVVPEPSTILFTGALGALLLSKRRRADV